MFFSSSPNLPLRPGSVVEVGSSRLRASIFPKSCSAFTKAIEFLLERIDDQEFHQLLLGLQFSDFILQALELFFSFVEAQAISLGEALPQAPDQEQE